MAGATTEEAKGGEAPRARILMVDDHPANLVALEAILAPLGQTLVRATSGLEALRALLKEDFAVILLDVQMPGMDGFELAALLKTRERTRSTPIIFLTAIAREPSKIFLGYAQGAVDYLLKPYDPEILRSKVSVFVELWRKTAQIERQQELLRQRDREEAERRNEVRYRALTDAIPGCIWAARPDGRIYYANKAWLDYAGREGSAKAFSFFDALPADDEDRVRKAWADAIVHDRPLELEVRLRSRDGEFRWHLLRAVPQKDVEGEVFHWIATAFDVHTQKVFEEERSQLLAREQAARLQADAANRAKDDFLATISHELRTPLTAILGWTRMLRTGAVEPSGLPRALETIERNARVQAQLIEDILDVSRIVSGKMRLEPRRLDLRTVAQAALEAVRPAAQAKGIELRASLGEWRLECEGDAARLQQIICNLLTNAIKFTPSGGTVCTTLTGVRGRERSQAEITVADSGIGISPSFLPHVFERFRQADSSITRAQGGLGLGLAIVRHLVEAHGGTVRAESEGEGKGARFVVQLPLCGAPAKREVVAVAASDEVEVSTSSLSGLKVLVVDDEVDARDLLFTVLRRAGAEVVGAATADEAVEALLRDRPDVLLSDLGLPRQDGYALIRRVRCLPVPVAQIPAAALSAYASAEAAQLALEAGYQRHVAKPIEPSGLVALVGELAGNLDELSERRRAARIASG